MKIYYYFLFRVFSFVKDKLGKDEGISLFISSGISSIALFYNLATIYILVCLLTGNALDDSGYVMAMAAGILVIIWIINYLLFVRPKKFLEQNFKKYWVYDISVLGYLILTGVFFRLVVNYNRAMLG